MYALAMSKAFSSQHFLIGGDWGDENSPHSHQYRLEVVLEGERLDEHGFLVDIVEFEEQIDRRVRKYQGAVLNEIPAFSGLNPSIEIFCRVVAREIDGALLSKGVQSILVKIWEDDIAWASYHLQRA
jgi:6-pyruvoyltetrahydropterin/6-carboxytetrahydropterin synthase